jgi:hypothetical protein
MQMHKTCKERKYIFVLLVVEYALKKKICIGGRQGLVKGGMYRKTIDGYFFRLLMVRKFDIGARTPI